MGGFFGDEGKGKLIGSFLKEYKEKKDFFFSKQANKNIVGYCIRTNGGPNGGHSLVINGKKITGHVLPSTILNKNFLSVIGAGCVIDPEGLINEINDFKKNNFFNGILKIDDRVDIILRAYRILDGMRNGKKSTGSGIADVYCYKGKRVGIKIRDLLNKKRLIEKLSNLIPMLHLEFKYLLLKQNNTKNIEEFSQSEKNKYEIFLEKNSIENQTKILFSAGINLKKYISLEIANELREAVSENKPLLNETSQSYFLGIDSGIEYGTSSSINPTYLFVSQGIPTKAQNIELVVKAFGSRVGESYFVGEFFNRNKLPNKEELLVSLGFKKDAKREKYKKKAIEMITSNDKKTKANGINLYYNEFGETTKRPRGKAPLDLVTLRSLFNQIAKNSDNRVRLWINQIDGMEHFKKLKLITAYKNEKGEEFKEIPNLCDIEMRKLKPVYIEINSWNKPLSNKFGNWPKEAKNYLKIISKETGFTIGGVGNGPQSEDLIFVDKNFN